MDAVKDERLLPERTLSGNERDAIRHQLEEVTRSLAPSEHLYAPRQLVERVASSLRLFGWLSAFAMLAALVADLLILRPTVTFLSRLARRIGGTRLYR
jgi:hypothetical protein